MQITLVKPTFDELSFRQLLLSDEKTMAYNQTHGGRIDFSKERWNEWYYKWIGANDPHYYYRYLYSHELDCYVGEIAYHLKKDTQRYICGVIVHAKFRHQGIGKIGLNLLCEEAKKNGIDELYDEILLDNPSLQLFVNNGFQMLEKTDIYDIVKKEL